MRFAQEVLARLGRPGGVGGMSLEAALAECRGHELQVPLAPERSRERAAATQRCGYRPAEIDMPLLQHLSHDLLVSTAEQQLQQRHLPEVSVERMLRDMKPYLASEASQVVARPQIPPALAVIGDPRITRGDYAAAAQREVDTRTICRDLAAILCSHDAAWAAGRKVAVVVGGLVRVYAPGSVMVLHADRGGGPDAERSLTYLWAKTGLTFATNLPFVAAQLSALDHPRHSPPKMYGGACSAVEWTLPLSPFDRLLMTQRGSGAAPDSIAGHRRSAQKVGTVTVMLDTHRLNKL